MTTRVSRPSSRSVRYLTLGALAAITLTPSLSGQDLPARRSCADVTTQAALNECFAYNARQAALTLQMLLGELQAELSQDEYQQLVSIQGLWEQYRDQHCEWRAAFFGRGSIGPTIYWSCMEHQTDLRVDALKLLLCEGAGMTGPCAASRKYDRPEL